MDRIEGIVPVVQTPLKNGQVDLESLRRHVKWLIEKPIGGLWILGTGSEDMHLTFDQRLVVADEACRVNYGRVPLFLGCSFYSISDSENFIQETLKFKKTAYHFLPYHPLLSWGRIFLVYERLSRMAPLWAYSSANWSRSFPIEFVKRLKGVVKGIKFSSQRTSDLQKVIALQDDDFQVMTAVASQFLVCLQMGAKASTTSVAAVYPDLFTKLYTAYREGFTGEAMKCQERIDKACSGLSETKGDNFLSAADEKQILVNLGLYKTAEMTFPYRESQP